MVLLLREATDFVEGDPRLRIVQNLEELTFDDLLSRKVKDAIAPLLANVAAISFLANVPSERGREVVKNPFFLRVLVEHELGVEDLPGEHKVVVMRQVSSLRTLHAVHLGNVRLVVSSCH